MIYDDPSLSIINKILYNSKIRSENTSQNYTYNNEHHNNNNKLYPYGSSWNHINCIYSQPLSKIKLQSNSINAMHAFYAYHNPYQQSLSFVQMGVQGLFSEKIISIGAGNRYSYNNQYAFGYNVFCHYPSTINYPIQPCSINFGGELWLHQNTLCIFNSYYNLNHFFSYKKSPQQHIQLYPTIGYQIGIHIKPPYISKFTGKLELEHFLYDKENHDFSHICEKNYIQLVLGLEYKPIPLLGFQINKYFYNHRNQDVDAQISIDYQFNVPIMQQIYHTNTKKYDPSLEWNYLAFMVKPLILHTDIHKKNCTCNKNSIIQSLPQIQKISGKPGEIKIIKLNHKNDECITWDQKSLQDLGGNIELIENNTYALHMPPLNDAKTPNIIELSYTVNNNQIHNDEEQITPKIITVIINQDNVHQSLPSSTSSNKKVISNINCDTVEKNPDHVVSSNKVELNFKKDIHSRSSAIVNRKISSVDQNFKKLSSEKNSIHHEIKRTSNYNNTKKSVNNDNINSFPTFSLPPAPPLPKKIDTLSSLPSTSTQVKSLDKSNIEIEEQKPSTSSYDPTKEVKDKTNTPSNNDKSSVINIKNQNYPKRDNDFYRQLFEHREKNFSCLNKQELFQRIEDNVNYRKKIKYLNNIEQMFFRTQHLIDRQATPPTTTAGTSSTSTTKKENEKKAVLLHVEEKKDNHDDDDDDYDDDDFNSTPPSSPPPARRS